MNSSSSSPSLLLLLQLESWSYFLNLINPPLPHCKFVTTCLPYGHRKFNYLFLQQSLLNEDCNFCPHPLSFVNWINQLRKSWRELWSFSPPFSGFCPSGPQPWGELLITGPSVPAEIVTGTRWSSTISNGQSSCCSTGMWSWAVLPCHILSLQSLLTEPLGTALSTVPHPEPVCMLPLAETGDKAFVLSQICAAECPCSAGLFGLEHFFDLSGIQELDTFNPGLVCLTGCCWDYWWHSAPSSGTELGTHCYPLWPWFLTRCVQSFI